MKNGNLTVKSLLTLGALFAFAAPSLAQTPTPVPAAPAPATPVPVTPAKHQNWLAKLNLTPDQKAKIKPIELNTRKQVKAIHASTTLTPDQQKAQIKSVREASRTQIMEILTPEQKAMIASEMKQHGKKARKGTAQ